MHDKEELSNRRDDFWSEVWRTSFKGRTEGRELGLEE